MEIPFDGELESKVKKDVDYLEHVKWECLEQ